MKKAGKISSIIALVILLTFALTACGGTKTQTSSGKNLQTVNLSVERTGNLLTGIGKVSVYVDGDEVMKVKNNQTESVELRLSPGTHTIQTKGQGDKSSELKFEVKKGQDNTFSFHTEISNIYGVKLTQN